MPFSEKDEEKLWHAVFGNGRPGMDEVLRVNTKTIAEITAKVSQVQTSVDALRIERQAATNRAEGRRELWNWLRFALGLVAVVVTIIGGFGRLQVEVVDLAQQLSKFPNLP